MQRILLPGSVASDVVGDVFGVATNPAEERRAEGVEEQEPDEVKNRDGLHDSSFLDGEPVPTGWEREVDPVLIRRVSRTPDHIRDLENTPILEERETVSHCSGLRSSFDISCRRR